MSNQITIKAKITVFRNKQQAAKFFEYVRGNGFFASLVCNKEQYAIIYGEDEQAVERKTHKIFTAFAKDSLLKKKQDAKRNKK